MGQAAVDLPDPTKDLSTAHAGGADDLLAQLAGDEIDRLLAESDVEPEPEPVAKVAPPPKLETPSPPALAETLMPIESHRHLEIPTDIAIASPVEPASGTEAQVEPHAETLHDMQHDRPDAATSVPLWLKPLVWMNAPLDALPDPLRELIGKIAIATTANAVAVLGYVALFRRHH